MKHTDLMLNDLVMYQGKILRVGCISDYDIKIDLFEDGEYTPYAEIWQEELDEIELIPLTAEILEKNGFCFANSNNPQISIGLIYHNSARFNEAGEGVIEEAVFIKYIHELQHALRLCGLTELADNFKV